MEHFLFDMNGRYVYLSSDSCYLEVLKHDSLSIT